MSQSIRLDIPVLLPEVKDDQDACVARLVSMLEGRNGIDRVHCTHSDGDAEPGHDVGQHPADEPPSAGALCLHFDPERISISQITEIARRAGATITERYAHEVISFRSIGSEDSGTAIEAALLSLPGVTAATVNFAAQLARVEYERERTTHADIVARLADAGAPAVSERRAADTATPPPAEANTDVAPTSSVESSTWYERNHELAWSVTCGVVTLAGWIATRAGAPHAATIGLFVVAYFFGARDNIGHLVKDLRRGQFHFNIDLLMVVAAVGAAILGEWVEGALLLFLFSLGHALEHYALGRARNAIKALADLAPQTATVRRNGSDAIVPIADVRLEDLVIIRPAERVSVDGIVSEGRSAVNQAPITGESVPVDKAAGDQVFAGTVNGEGVLVIRVSAAIGDRTLDRVVRLVAEASTQKAATQQFADRFERVFVPLVLVVDLSVMVLPPMLGIWSWSDSFYRAMALLVAASPCALALGTPATVLAGIAQAARNGILIKGGAHLEALGGIRVFAVDKTGTVTKGEPEVVDLVPMPGVDESTLLSTAASVEMQSQHPLARAIVRGAQARSLVTPSSNDVQSITGKGVRAMVGGSTVTVGRLSLFDDQKIPVPAPLREEIARLEKAGRSTMVVHATGRTPEWLGAIGVADQPRPEVRQTFDALRQLGVKRIVMLTGDNIGVATAVANSVGIDDVRARLMPEDKVTAVKELAAEGPVAMVGDGVNDAPALAHATVGIAMGGAGTAAALETADVALMGDDLARLPFAVGLSRQAHRVIRQNLYISLGVIGVLSVMTIAGWARIGPAVVVHEGSTLVVIANALRLLRYRSPVFGKDRSA